MEEFIGLCPKVVVFRHGTIFDILKMKKVKADTLLEGMFESQTAGIGSTSINKSSSLSPQKKQIETNTSIKKPVNIDKKL